MPYPLFARFLLFFVVSLDDVVVVVIVVVVVVVVLISSPTAATIPLSIGSVRASPCRKGRSTYNTSLGTSKV